MIKLIDISKTYHTKEGEIKAIDNFSALINKNEIISIVGPSGCGKSTILSIISSIDKEYNGKIIKDDNLKIGYMLQSDALLPFLTIYENAILGLKIQNKINEENIEFVNKLLKLYNLDEFRNKYPKNLSGGMRQRCALIRTLSLKPDILLLDEPFSALDEMTRLMISEDVYKYVKNNNITVLLVTHNINESIYFSDKVIILTKRPSNIKNIIDINLTNNNSIIERRNDKNFNYYFNLIKKDLETNE